MNNAKVFSDEAAAIYERAIQTLMKKSMLIYFAYADFEEVGSLFPGPNFTALLTAIFCLLCNFGAIFALAM